MSATDGWQQLNVHLRVYLFCGTEISESVNQN